MRVFFFFFFFFFSLLYNEAKRTILKMFAFALYLGFQVSLKVLRFDDRDLLITDIALFSMCTHIKLFFRKTRRPTSVRTEARERLCNGVSCERKNTTIKEGSSTNTFKRYNTEVIFSKNRSTAAFKKSVRCVVFR